MKVQHNIPSLTSPGKGEVGRAASGWGLDGPRFSRTRDKTAQARKLRCNQTDVERKLWSKLRHGQLGASFRRQHPIGPYIVDFYCAATGLVIELDGGQHAEEAAAAYDHRRTAFLNDRGLAVLRFWNSDVVENCDGVIEAILMKLTELISPPTPALPLSGGGSREQRGSSPLCFSPALPLFGGGSRGGASAMKVQHNIPSLTSPGKGEVGRAASGWGLNSIGTSSALLPTPTVLLTPTPALPLSGGGSRGGEVR